uniref:Uncharacterized protein n=1 Tax=Callorhinus ursinus TaxID=34884 RepID=A0A3Q7MQM4_CALUR|nr:putative protein T-ENOL isoform X1 [Callorhinus ursinus]XP_025709629.1 putative protein T-ENOL isoform X1 [Callorhinus ursinus]
MASTPTRNGEKGSRMSQAGTPSGGSLKVSLSRSEEFLTRISTELTNEALFIAGCHMNSVPTKEKQTQDRGTQISKHATSLSGSGSNNFSDAGLYFQCPSRPEAPIPEHASDLLIHKSLTLRSAGDSWS